MLKHSWDITPKQAIELQKKLSKRVKATPLCGHVATVAGIDCAFIGDDEILAAAVLCDAKTMQVIRTASVCRPCGFPYVPGLLSFREAPAVIAAVEGLQMRPDLLMCDGQGLAHPRGLGIASHVGLWLDMPTIGVAKSRLCGSHRMLHLRRGCRAALKYCEKTVGIVLRTRDGVKPLYISVGHRITLDEAIYWVLRCCRGFRLPEPTRLAHQHVTRLKVTGMQQSFCT